MKKIFLFFTILVFCCTCLLAQGLKPFGKLNLNLDYARFRYDAKSCYFEIYYAFYPFQLTYNQQDGKYAAGVKVATQLINKDNKKLIIDDQTYLPIAINDTSETSYRYPFITQAGYVVPLGEYTLSVIAEDSINSTRQDSISLPVSITPYPEKLVCSDLELCSNIKSSSKKGDPFFKNSLEVVPNATLIFGVTAHPVAFHYLELYKLDPNATYTVKNSIMDFQGKVIRESSKSRKYGVSAATEVGMTNVTSIKSGKYLYCLELTDVKSQQKTRTQKIVFIYKPHLEVKQQAAPVDEESIFTRLSGEELAEEFREAKYIATDEEIELFPKIESDEGKRKFLAGFWTKVLNGRMGRPPMKRSEYIRRISEADERYNTVGKAGWLTDRGRVYILYGKPDYIERNLSTSENKPNVIWHYYNIENGVQFVFIDQLGFGNFRLVHSTKRGELWDDDWQRFLR